MFRFVSVFVYFGPLTINSSQWILFQQDGKELEFPILQDHSSSKFFLESSRKYRLPSLEEDESFMIFDNVKTINNPHHTSNLRDNLHHSKKNVCKDFALLAHALQQTTPEPSTRTNCMQHTTNNLQRGLYDKKEKKIH